MTTYVLSGYNSVNYPTIAVVFAATFIVYNLPIFIYLLKNVFLKGTNIKYLFSPIHDALLMILLIASIVSIAIFLPHLNLRSILALIVLSFVVLFYFVPVRNGKTNLRQIGCIKAIVISIVWISATCIIPLINYDHEFVTTDILLLSSRFIYVYVLVMLFDIRDIATDKCHNLRTLAIILGKKYSIVLCEVLLCMYLFTISISSISYSYKYAMILSAIPLFFIIIKSINVRYKYFFLFVVDGFLVLQFILILIFKYFY
ncbi:MAG: hypothetical protein ACQPRH_02090 [Solitalea-like symbiont of Tyrophagus putrescentiae]